jgi:hypothetical protein
MSSVEQRIVRNNRTFREANEQIRDRVDDLKPQMERFPFLCECPLPSCSEVVYLTLPEYARVRAEDRHFLTKVGHETAEGAVATVVSREDGYVVVEKTVG